MKPWRSHWTFWGVMALAALLTACGNGNGSDSDQNRGAGDPPTATATPTETPQPTATTGVTQSPTPVTPTPVAGGVNILVVVNREVAAGTDDALGLPPERPEAEADNRSFDRALSFADWSVEGVAGKQGVTGADGRFQITGLPPGQYTLNLSKTVDGNLVSVSVPFAVGDDGQADVIMEVSWGEAKATSNYLQDGQWMREVHAPNGTVLVTRDGRVLVLGDATRPFVDPDGDGIFAPRECVDHLWLCPDRAACGGDRVCSCTSSCPLCEDCRANVCVPPGIIPPYQCEEDGSCALPGDRCLCASSCPECDDCALAVCVPACEPAEITEIAIVGGPSELRVGRSGSLRAVARLSDGSQVDVTYLADWESSAPAVASVDSWGTVKALAVGNTTITAAVGTITSDPWQLEVVERPSLQRIHLQNVSCIFPWGRPDIGNGEFPAVVDPPIFDAFMPPPPCRQVVQVGGTIRFVAVGEFADGSYEDISNEAEWQVVPAEVGDVVGGLFTGRAPGTAQLRASLGTVVSDAAEIRVVTEPTVVALSVFAESRGFPIVVGLPVAPDGAPLPCFDCFYGLTVLRGDKLQFRATAQYDTGSWEDVTDRVSWRSDDTTVATIDITGLMTAVEGGVTKIDAILDEVTSNAVEVRVVNEATLQSISIYQEGTDRVLAKSDQTFFRASGFYDIGLERDVTTEASWFSSDETVGGFDAPGVFTGRSGGLVQVWAELGGKRSNSLSLEVFETSELDYCDAENVNRGVWSDSFNRVVLESNCDQYSHPEVVALRYTVTETRPHGGIFDPCLDLYVFQGNRRIRTLREEGCGDPFLSDAAPGRDEAVLKYQWRAFWDLKDDTGAPVPPGVYTVFGRFYLYYDPIVSIEIAVVGQDGQVPCTENPCGNGCGYVHACGSAPPPLICPDVCVPLCECPPGWGVTPDGGCERCVEECCRPGAACLPGQPPCEIECCPAGARCRSDVPPCEQKCCPSGASCADVFAPCDLECCPPNARCTAEIPPCEPDCCPAGTSCSSGIPPCEPPKDCCPEGEVCVPELPPCGPQCCPANARCTPNIPPCEPACCLPGDVCIPELPPCEGCCPVGALCIIPWPPCEEPCCRPGEQCDPGMPPCPTLPDLIPSGVHPGPCSLADCVPQPTVEVCVGNLGEQAAGPFSVLLGNREILKFVGVGALGEECGQAPYAESMTVAVDFEGEVIESREDNNRETFVLPTPVPTACDFIPPDCIPGTPTPRPTPTPIEQIEGNCFRNAGDCEGSGFPTSRARCCEISRLDASILSISWCPADQLDPEGNGCRETCSDPCSGLRPTDALCGNGVVDPEEQCDDGNRVSGDDCAENCTLETRHVFEFGEGSRASVQTSSFRVPLPLRGRQIITAGQSRSQDATLDGTIPLVVKSGGFQLDPVSVPGVLCACVRGVEAPEFGPGNVGKGAIGCAEAGLVNVDYLASLDHNIDDEDPDCRSGIVEDGSRAHPHAGVCNGILRRRFSGVGPRGSMTLDLNATISLIYDGGACNTDRTDPAKGPDGIPCNGDDPTRVAATRLLLTTGAASAEVLDAGNERGTSIGPETVRGYPLDCQQLMAGESAELSGLMLVSALPALDVEDVQLIGDVVLTTEFVASGGD